MGMSLTLTVINWSSSLSTLAPSVASGSVLHTQRRDTCSQERGRHNQNPLRCRQVYGLC